MCKGLCYIKRTFTYIINSRYQEIGVAVVQGTLQGTQTALVVQLFGTPVPTSVAQKPLTSKEELPEGAPKPAYAQNLPQEKIIESTPPASVLPVEKENKPLFSPLGLTKAMAIFTIGLLLGVFLMDILVISRKKVSRLSSRSLAQMLFLFFILITSLLVKQGAIL